MNKKNTKNQVLETFRVADGFKTIRNTPEYREAIHTAKERAAGKSELSGKKCDELQAHHIVPVATNPNLACDLDNIICLTPEEHKAFHGLYGNGYEASADDFESFKNDFEAQMTRAAKYAANRAKVANLYRQKGEKALAKFLKLNGYSPGRTSTGPASRPGAFFSISCTP